MRAPFLKSLPALLAACILALCSGCASAPQPRSGSNPAPEALHVPTSPCDISGIRRGAGEVQFETNTAEDLEGWAYVVLIGLLTGVFVVYGLVWCGMQIYHEIDKALQGSKDEDAQP
jgi:hypothetical protein